MAPAFRKAGPSQIKRHILCILDLDREEVWCHDGYAHNLAWIEGAWAD